MQLNQPRPAAFARSSALLVLCLLAMGACTSRRGHVHVSHPEVFGRERLVAERLREVQWLERQYDQFDPNLVQGSFDERRQRAVRTQLELGVQDAVGNVFAPGADGSASRVGAPPSGLAALGTGSFADSNTVNAGPVSATNVERFEDRLAYRQRISEAIRDQMLDDAHDLQGLVLRELGFELTLTPGDGETRRAIVLLELANSCPKPDDLEQLRPILERRLEEETARLHARVARLRGLLKIDEDGKPRLSIELDADERSELQLGADALRSTLTEFHEAPSLLSGLALLWLRGDNSALKPHDPSVVRVAHELCAVWGQIRWIKDRLDPQVAASIVLRDSRQEDAMHAAAKAWFSAIEPAKRARADLERSATAAALVAARSPLVARTEGVELGDLTLEVHINSVLQAERAHGNLAADMQAAVGQLEKSVTESERANRKLDTARSALLSSLRGLELALTADWKTALENCSKNVGGLSVTQVRPLNVAESVAAATADRKLLDLAARVGYLSGSVGADLAARYESEILDRAKSMERFPTIVGFGDGPTRFGWIFGPSYSAPRGGEASSHLAQISHSVSARVVFPALARRVTLSGRRAWICPNGDLSDDAGNEFSLQEFVQDGRSGDRLWGGHAHSVELPPDPHAVVAALGSLVDAARRPAVASVTGELKEGATRQTLLIEGFDLWRNPEVFVAGRKASSVAVTADMRGLVAEFTEFQLPSPRTDKLESHPLRVVTSTGTASFRDVKVHREAQVGAFVRTALTKFVTKSGPRVLELEVDQGLFPSAYHELTVRLRPRGAVDWFEPSSIGLRPAPTRLQFELKGDVPASKWGTTGDPYELTVDVRVRLRPSADPVSVPMPEDLRLRWFEAPASYSPVLDSQVVKVNSNYRFTAPIKLLRSPKESAAGVGPFTDSGEIAASVSRVGASLTQAVKLLTAKGSSPTHLAEISAADLNNLATDDDVRKLIADKSELTLKLQVTHRDGNRVETFDLKVGLTL